MASLVYLLCAFMSCLCAWLLFRQRRRAPTALLMWSSLGFVGLAAHSVLLFVDLVLVQQISLLVLRNVVGLLSMGTLVYGFIWSTR